MALLAKCRRHRIDFNVLVDSICQHGAFVYRLGRGLLKAEGGVRFPYALPISLLINRINHSVSFQVFESRLVLKPSAKMSFHFGYVCHW